MAKGVKPSVHVPRASSAPTTAPVEEIDRGLAPDSGLSTLEPTPAATESPTNAPSPEEEEEVRAPNTRHLIQCFPCPRSCVKVGSAYFADGLYSAKPIEVDAQIEVPYIWQCVGSRPDHD